MPNSNKAAYFYWLQLTCVLMLGLYLLFFSRWQLETNLLALLPQQTQNHQKSANLALAEQALFADKQKQVVIAITGDNAMVAYQMLHRDIVTIDNVIQIALPQPTISELAEFYLPYRHNFLSQTYLHALTEKQALTKLVNEQLTQLANPFVSATLASDPRLNLAHYLQENLSTLGEVEYQHGIPVINHKQQTYLISRLQLNIDGFSLNDSKKIAEQLQLLFNDITVKYSVKLHYSGIIFHTAESTNQAKQEISIFGTLSMLGVMLLLLVVFRSLTPLFTALITIAIAAFYGVTAILIFFEKLHILTLVFAITLIGIVIDYCFHFFVYAAQPELTQKKSITKPLILSFLTTILGYFTLVFSPLTLLSQVALFMIFGLLGALLTVMILLPSISKFGRLAISSKVHQFSGNAIAFFITLLNKRRLIFTLLFSALIGLFVIQPINFNDDVRLLNSSPAWLLNNEKNIAELFNKQKSTRLIVQANNVQSLLEQQELIIDKLLGLQPNINIKSIVNLLPSVKRQRAHFTLLEHANKQGQFDSALAITGLNDPISTFKPLSFDQFATGPLSPLNHLFIAKYSITQNQVAKIQYAAWLEVSGDDLTDMSIEWLNHNENVAIFDKAEQVSSTLALYRQGIIWLLVIALAMVTLVLMTKFGIKAGSLASFCTITSGIAALLISQLLLGHLNIFNLLAALLILALAIDYVIFYQEHGLCESTFLAITLSAISSALVFGMLAFSKTPAVNSFGLTVMIGIIVIFILAPFTNIKHNN